MNYDKLLQDLFKAYYECRKNKRKTINQIQFEMDYELNLINLADEIYKGTYEVGKSIAFIVDKPVKREIFAGDFRDRVVHHYIINKINHIFEKKFIYDSYSCRVGKGTLFGVKRIEKFIRQCSENYVSDWQGLPKSKSLFFANENTGLPIGNLTSQIFANFYLDFLDKFIKQKLKIKYYGRYVDDFVLIHPDKEYLKYCQKEIEKFLKDKLKLTLHPNKIYLQHYSKGVLFLGSFIKAYRTYLKNKTKGNIFEKIQVLNNEIKKNKGKCSNILKQNFRQTINSYMGLIKWNSSYKLRKKYF